jgi:heparan-alpha-glucosaminide N-acetyltransferase
MSASTTDPEPERLLALDAYRGLAMLACVSGGFAVAQVVNSRPTDTGWEGLARQLQFALWRGCSPWDLIPPSFVFLAGVAAVYSAANRRARGQSWMRMLVHALARSLVLILLGIFLASHGHARTNFVFTEPLTQIGLGTTVVFLLLGRSANLQWAIVVLLLVVDWGLFAAYPLPEANDPHSPVALDPAWRRMEGFAEHWEKNTNFGAAFDRWFLNRLPRPENEPFRFDPDGYTTLNIIPATATMILGAITGRWLRAPRPTRAKVVGLVIVGAGGIVAGTVLDQTDLCPLVPRLWTPSWALYSAGWAAWLLAGFFGLTEGLGVRRWTWPLVVVGVNPLAMSLMTRLLTPWIGETLHTHLGPDLFAGITGPIIESAAVLVVLWLIALGMSRRGIIIKL